jgi:DNA-binding winged helix-turn-helix (wHTH) protein
MAARIPIKLAFDAYELEPERLSLTHAGQPVHLTRKPFQVLLYLIEHRERLVTRHELLEQFWAGREVYEESVTKCVARFAGR